MENRIKVSCTLCKKIKGETKQKVENLSKSILEKEISRVNVKILGEKEDYISFLEINYRQNIPKDQVPLRNKTVKKFSEFYFSLPNNSHYIFLQIINNFDYFISLYNGIHTYDEMILVAMFITIQVESINIFDGYDNIFSFYPELKESEKITNLKNIQNLLITSINIFYPNEDFCDFMFEITEEYFLNLMYLQKNKKGTPFSKISDNKCYFKNLTYELSINLYEEILKNIEEKYLILPKMKLYIGIFWTVLNISNLHFSSQHLNLTVFFKLLEDLNINYIDEIIELGNYLISKDYKVLM